MRINDDLSRPVLVDGAQLPWMTSPAAGVERRMLFRIGDEVARATSIVRYAPGSAFPQHVHSGGEEFVVLDGVFQDEHGDYPAGSYIRNPPGTAHVPASEEGCTIFVRLWQFRAADRASTIRRPGEGAGVADGKAIVLFEDDYEVVRLVEWTPGSDVELKNARGLEFLVMSGELSVGMQRLGPQGWGRLPAGVSLKATVGPGGVKVWMKDAPLLHPDVLRLSA